MCLKQASSLAKLLISKPIVAGHPQASAFQLSSRRDALRLYRECLRSIRSFQWNDKDGVLWADKLRTSVRSEFEEARLETDPELIRRMLVSGQDCLAQVQVKLWDNYQSMVDHVDKTRNN
eukprot:TRINITY_DN12665_c0_g1_i1.p1 TRINITY_DN12665_c0_g1~~TRINITY_DN12665_c0_g1_i1.p1  ORF type:complete len:120 (-),score=26.82 TRINITY_DN12665_c0_g1_i1:415-774(-)